MMLAHSPTQSRSACSWPSHFEKFFSALQARGGQVQGHGAPRWKAKCPAHDDQKASLSVGLGNKKQLLLRCHSPSACTWQKVLEALGCEPSDLFPDPPKKKESRMSRRQVCVYDYKNASGALVCSTVRYEPKDFRQRRPNPNYDPAAPNSDRENPQWYWNLDGVERVLYKTPELLEAIKKQPGKILLLCYTPDTDVLTRRGWVSFPDLKNDDFVAQYDLDSGEITFTKPRDKQVLPYSGELVHMKSDFCDLMVTPDHRQPVWSQGCSKKIAPASEVRNGHRIPTAGIYTDGSDGPTETMARLMVCWQADGVREPRGDQVSWNIKKDRKKIRLRGLLSRLGISWTEHNYPSTPGWTNFRVTKASMQPVFDLCPNKEIPDSAVNWMLPVRLAVLDEIGHWDGDIHKSGGRRYFTGSKSSAQNLQMIAVVSGWWSSFRVDSREGRNDNYVVNLQPKSWRSFGNHPVRVNYQDQPFYDGRVYCCTVETGLLVVRRNGKVSISGNCEGEKDCDLAWSHGIAATTNPMGAMKWREEYTHFLKDQNVVCIPDEDPVNPTLGYSGGVEHMMRVCDALSGVAKSVKLLRLPGLESIPKGDLSDWWQMDSRKSKTPDEIKRELGFLILKCPAWVRRGGTHGGPAESPTQNNSQAISPPLPASVSSPPASVSPVVVAPVAQAAPAPSAHAPQELLASSGFWGHVQERATGLEQMGAQVHGYSELWGALDLAMGAARKYLDITADPRVPLNKNGLGHALAHLCAVVQLGLDAKLFHVRPEEKK